MRAINVSIIIGAFMLTFGSLLSVANSLMRRDYYELLERSLPRLLLFGSVSLPFLVYLDASKGGGVIMKAALELGGGDPLATLVLIGFTLGVAVMIVSGALISALEGHGVLPGLAHAALEAYETLLMVVGNLPSFLRIMALAMTHSSLNLAVADIAEIVAEGGLIADIAAAAIYAAGNLAIAALEGLLAFAHSARLHYYEWFNKFYTGGGIPYTPVKLEGVTLKLA